MGTFDTFVDGDIVCQTKMFDCLMITYHPGDEVPLKDSFTMVFPDFEGARYGIFQKGIFVKLTNDVDETTDPYYDKWGGIITDLTEDVGNRSPIKQAVDAWVNSYKNKSATLY